MEDQPLEAHAGKSMQRMGECGWLADATILDLELLQPEVFEPIPLVWRAEAYDAQMLDIDADMELYADVKCWEIEVLAGKVARQ